MKQDEKQRKETRHCQYCGEPFLFDILGKDIMMYYCDSPNCPNWHLYSRGDVK